MRILLDQPIACAVRIGEYRLLYSSLANQVIVPVRNTDFSVGAN